MVQDTPVASVGKSLTREEFPSWKRKKSWIALGKLFVSTVLIYWVIRTTELDQIFNAVHSADIELILVAYLMLFIGHLLSVLRWRVLLRAQGFDSPTTRLFGSYMIGIFFNNFLPSTIGGDSFRAYDSWKIGNNKEKAVAVILVDRLFGVLALFIFAVSTLVFAGVLLKNMPFLSIWVMPGILLFGFGILTVILAKGAPDRRERLPLRLWTKVVTIFKRIVNELLFFQNKKGALIKALVFSVLLQANVILHYFIISKALGLLIPLSSFFLLIPVCLFVMMIPVSINAIGIRENIFALLFVQLGASRADAIALAWIAYGLVVVQGILGGIVYGLRR